ncbi:F-box/LRR-repeat protein At3g26922-like [Spinacia oleracea]|uniref:F-box/LRR-repeat protein At3g26922-like n=1 Tax=Spinacia oleracea TaxID=3562 RepID=A0A9R0IHG3_SPIOL|nr:F-box/LRR-repeat protein At3g26922-like [Spinacia oleracea]
MDEDNSMNINCRINNNGYEKDRLSSLPNSLLIEILSLLPLNSAAATSVLSRRWVPLWTQLPQLSIEDGYTQENFQKFITTTNHILQQFTTPHIQSFNLRFYHQNLELDQFHVCSASLNSWIPLICSRNPANFEVSFDFSRFCRQFIPLPTCIFKTNSLVNLKLSGFFYCCLPETGVVNLPNLKKLSLNGLDFDPQVLRTLFKSCPLLETLFLKLRLMEDELIDISTPNLKSLTILMRGSSYRSTFLIDAPLLEEIEVQDCLALYHFVKIPCNLQKSSIGCWSSKSEDSIFTKESDYMSNTTNLLKGISNVNCIQLVNNVAIFNTFNQMDANVWSLFHNLIHLRLGLSEEHVNWGARIPSCLLSKLKKIDLLVMKGDDNDVNSIKYILSNADVLEKLYISRFASSGKHGKSQLWKEYKFCGNLFLFTRSSLICKIEFDGAYIHASSCGSQNVSGNSEIDWLRSQMWPASEEDD